MRNLIALPYWRLSGYYLFFFGAVGAFVPYWPVYLQSLGLSPAQIGIMLSIVMAARILAPYWWGWLADRHGRRMAIVRWTALGTLAGSVGVLTLNDSTENHVVWLALWTAVVSFFWNAGLPQFEAVTLAYLHGRTFLYSRIRVWGSLGFIAVVAGVGAMLETWPVATVPWVLTALFTGIWLVSLSIADQATPHTAHPDGGRLNLLLRRWPVWALLLVCTLMQASHGPYYTFYSIFLTSRGYNPSLIGGLWALGVIAEIGVFLIADKLMHRFALCALLTASLLIAALRWILLSLLVDYFWVVIVLQGLHAATFGLFHVVSIQLVHQTFPGKLQGRGLALYSSIGFGVGSMAGALASGYAWQALGAETTFILASITALAGAGLAWFSVHGHLPP